MIGSGIRIGFDVRLRLFAVAVLLCFAPIVLSQELQERGRLVEVGRQAYQDEKFAELDAVLWRYLKEKARTPSGPWKSYLVERGALSTADHANAKSDKDWQRLEAKAQRWIAASPKSPFARINLSQVVLHHAWSIRGNGYADKVPADAWKPFRQELARANQLLESSKAIAQVDPAWYRLALTIAKADGRSREEVDALFDEAIAREPGYYETYFAMLTYLLPKWNGDLHEIEAFADNAVKRTRSFEGNSMYARIYWYASQTQFKNELFTSSFARWNRVDAGFQDVIARYPDQWNINHYAKFACLAGDNQRSRELLTKIKQPVAEAWEPAGLFEKCQQAAGIRKL